MANYKMIIQYDGTRYKGWQRQKTTDQTIQGKIEAILSRQYGRTIEIDGSGRTDAGVHAHGQVANFRLPDACCAGKTPEELCEELRQIFVQYLPEDIDDCIRRRYLTGEIQMCINVACCADVTVTEPLLNLLRLTPLA